MLCQQKSSQSGTHERVEEERASPRILPKWRGCACRRVGRGCATLAQQRNQMVKALANATIAAAMRGRTTMMKQSANTNTETRRMPAERRKHQRNEKPKTTAPDNHAKRLTGANASRNTQENR